MTYSIVAVDPYKKLFGVAVASGSTAVGSRVPWARTNTGSVATQAYTNPSLGPLILSLLSEGASAGEALRKALLRDPDPYSRQVAVIDRNLAKAYHNGRRIPAYSGGFEGRFSVCIANLVSDPGIPEAMCRVFDENLIVHGMAYSLLRALEAGGRLGGDRRGDKSAAILVVGDTEYGVLYDRLVDLRVDYDWDGEPVEKLRKLFDLWRGG